MGLISRLIAGRGATLLPYTLGLAAACAGPASAQRTFDVSGRVYAADTDTGVRNAIVSLGEAGSVLTGASGAFRFDDVAAGTWVVRVEAFGYMTTGLRVEVADDTVVAIPLIVSPLMLDTLGVELERLDFDGHVGDPTLDFSVVDARVTSSQGHAERSDAHGNFTLDEVYDGPPLRMVIGAFGYLPLDTTLIPDDDGRHRFELTSDPLTQRMIDTQVERIVEATSGRRSFVLPPMDRLDLLRYKDTFTVYDMLIAEYGERRLDGVQCIVLDDRQLLRQSGWAHRLQTMLPEEVERVVFLYRSAMLRIYTRDFLMRMTMSSVRLRTPSFFKPPFGEALCR